MAKQIPILVTIDGAGKVQAEVKGMASAFGGLDQAAEKTSRNGLKSAFDSSQLLRSEIQQLAQRIPIVGQLFNGLASDALKYVSGAKAVTEEVKSQKAAFNAFQAVLSGIAKGKNPLAGELFKDFGIDAEKGLRAPKEAFSQFISEFRRFPDEAGRARIAVDVFGNSAAKLLPTLEGTAAAESVVTTETAGMGASFLAVLGPIALVVAIVAALTAGVYLGGKAIFGLAQEASEAAGKIYDLSQKTNFSAETLSALKIAAETSGGSVETLATALGIFEKNLELASQGNKKLNKEFTALGITSRDNETALRQAFVAIGRLTDGTQQTAVAMQLFGRSGKDVLGILKDSGSDIDAFIRRMRDLGIVISTEDAKAADDFNDHLTLLSARFDGIKRQIGKETIPAFEAFFTYVESALSASKGGWQSWGDTLAKVILSVGVELAGLANVMKNVNWANFVPGYGLYKVGRDYAAGASAAADSMVGRYNELTNPTVGGTIGPGIAQNRVAISTAAAARTPRGSDPAAAAKRISELELKAELDDLKAKEDALDRSLKLREVSYAKYEDFATAIEIVRHRNVIDGLAKEALAAKGLRDENAKNVALKEIDGRRTAENNRSYAEQNKLADKTLSQTREQIALVDTLVSRSTRPRRTQDYFEDVRLQERAVDQRSSHFSDESLANSRAMAVEIDNLKLDLRHLQAENADDQFSEQRRLLTSQTEELDLTHQLQKVQDEIATGPYNEALRLQLAYYEAIHGVQLANEQALVKNIQNQVILAHQMDLNLARINDGVVDFLAQQKTLQETFQDVRTNSVRAFFDGIDSAIDRMTKRLGLAGSVIGTFLKDLAHLAASQFLQRLLGLGTGGQGSGIGGQVSGGGGSGGGLFGSLPGIIRNFTGGGAGGSATASGGGAGVLSTGQTPAQFLSALSGGGGMTPPALLTTSTIGQGFQSLTDAGTGVGGAAATGIFGGGALAALAPLLPFLGAGAGASLGGQSRFGNVVGGAGGLLAGGAAAAFLAPSLFGVGTVGGSSALMAGAYGLLTNPITIAAGVALIAAAVIIGRNKARQQAEKINNAAHLQTLPAIYDLLFRTQKGGITLSAAQGEWEQIHQQYLQSISGIKDSKTLNHALLWWDFVSGTKVDPGQPPNRTDAIWPQIAAAAKAGETAQLVKAHAIPEYSLGDMAGLVPYRGGMQTLIKVRPGERIDDVGLRASWMVPGVDTGRDSVYTFATPRSAVRTKEQQLRIPGFAAGSNAPSLGGRSDKGDVVFEVPDDSTAAFVKAVFGIMTSRDGRKFIVRTGRDAKSKQG